MGGRGAVAAVIAAWIGILLGPIGGAMTAWLAIGIAAGCAWLSLRAPPRLGAALALLAILGAAMARGGAHRLALDRARLGLGPGERWIRCEARVVEPPQDAAGEPVAVVAIDHADPPIVHGTRVRLRLPPTASPGWGDRIAVHARIEPPLGRRNPGGYDARTAASANDLIASGRAFSSRTLPATGTGGWARATIARWRRAVDRRLAALDPPTRELVVPLLVGDRSVLSTDLQAQFKASGLIHLLALSGLHVAWLSSVARAAAATAGVGNAGRELAGAACALAYIGLAGPIPSLVRAAVTEIVRCLGTARALDPLQALAIAGLLPLLVAPGWAFDLGFQLSCAATLGLVTLGDTRAFRSTIESGARAWVERSLLATIGAQIGAMPLLLGRFHALAWGAPLGNLVAVPVSGLLLTAAWIGVVVDIAWPGGGRVWFQATELLAATLRAITERAATLPQAQLCGASSGLATALAAAGAVLLCAAAAPPRTLAARARSPSRVRSAALSIGVTSTAMAVIALVCAPPRLPPPGRAWLVALDVGQGDAVALAFPDGWWLVDCGPRSPHSDAGESVVLPFLRWAAVRRLEALVLTHADGDHTGGARAVLRGVGAKRLWTPPALPGVPGPAEHFGGAPVAGGDLLRERPLVRALWPPPASAMIPLASDNAASLVLAVGEGGSRSLLVADIDSTVEARLPLSGPSGVLKVGHHGSASSTSAAWLDRVRPRLAVVSCGRRNPFGHPAPDVLARLGHAGVAVLRTDLEGAIWLELDRDSVRVIDWRRGPPPVRIAEARGAFGAGAARHP